MTQNERLSLEDECQTSRRWSSKFVRRVDHLIVALESHPWIFILLLAALYAVVIHRQLKPLWYDELFTYYIAQAPSFKQMLLWTHQVDLNPPLYYILARGIFHFFKPGPVSLRLPAIVSYFVAALTAYQFVGRRFSRLYGFLAALVLLGSSYAYYANEARPYALILGFLGIAAVSWQIAIDENQPRRWIALLIFIIAGFGMLLSHVLALIAYGAFFVAEFARLIARRKSDWPLWICLAVPLVSYATYRPLIQGHSGGVYPPAFQASIQKLFEDYSNLWSDVAPFLATAMILIVILSRNRGIQSETKKRIHLVFPEIVLAFGLLLVPLEIIVLFMRSHSQFYPRYGIPAIFGVAILVPYFIAWWTRNNRRAALICSIVFCFSVVTPAWFARHMQNFLQLTQEQSSDLTGESNIPLNKMSPDLPLVDASGLTFLEMSSRENPNFLNRVYFLVDPDAAMQYANANGFNNLAFIKKIFPIRGSVEPYRQFIKQHSTFLVLGTYSFPDDWLLRKLVAEGANVRFLGYYPTSYKDEQLYEVTLSPSVTADKP